MDTASKVSRGIHDQSNNYKKEKGKNSKGKLCQSMNGCMHALLLLHNTSANLVSL